MNKRTSKLAIVRRVVCEIWKRTILNTTFNEIVKHLFWHHVLINCFLLAKKGEEILQACYVRSPAIWNNRHTAFSIIESDDDKTSKRRDGWMPTHCEVFHNHHRSMLFLFIKLFFFGKVLIEIFCFALRKSAINIRNVVKTLRHLSEMQLPTKLHKYRDMKEIWKSVKKAMVKKAHRRRRI